MRTNALSVKSFRKAFFVSAFLCLCAGCCWMPVLDMPGKSWHGPLPERSPELQSLESSLKKDVEDVCALGPRDFARYGSLMKGASLLDAKFKEAGLSPYSVNYIANLPSWAKVEEAKDGKLIFSNIVAEVKGTELPDEIVVIGSHYDTAYFPIPEGEKPPSDNVGADDNVSGVATTLAIAREFAKNPGKRTMRFIAFVNEEEPFGQTDQMGSAVCAKRSAEAKEKIVAMITPECVGYYSDKPNSQKYPFRVPDKPDTGDFIAFVTNPGSAKLLKDCVMIFRQNCHFPSEGIGIPFGDGDRSDHWAYCAEGYQGLMVTDSANYRNPNYHSKEDKPATLDYRRMAIVVDGLAKTARVLSDRPSMPEN